MTTLHRSIIVAALLAGLAKATPSSGADVFTTWNGAAGDLAWSTPGNWSPVALPRTEDNVKFTDDGVADNPFKLGGAVNNVVDAGLPNARINSMGYMNSLGFHNTEIINTLTILSSSASDVANIADDGEPSAFFIGTGALGGRDDQVYATIIGDSLSLSNANANLSVSQISQTAGSHRATLDLTQLNEFSCVVSKVLIGHNFAQPDFAWRPTGELFLARNNLIKARVISVSDAYQNAGGACFLHLGTVNQINADRIRIGMHKCVGTIDIPAGVVGPSITLRDAAGTGRQLSWELGDEYETNTNLLFGFFTSNQARGTMNLSGAAVDALVDRITLGRGQVQRDATVRNGDGNGTLIFGGGTIDANLIEMGIQVPGPFIGGSVGNGVLTVNNDPGVGPALLLVRSNIVMTVQQPGNTDVNGSTAVITVADGSTLAVAGDILDGGGHSTINLNNGGKLDMKPGDDTLPGNITVDTLNIVDGTLVNFAILATSSINLLGANAQFIVEVGQAIAPSGVGTVGTLDVTGLLILNGDTLLDIRKDTLDLTADRVSATGGIELGGTLRVSYSGTVPLAIGDKVTLFSPVPLGLAPTLQLPPPGSGLAWRNNILVDGSIEVVPCSCGEPTTPPELAVTVSPTSLTLSWPADYLSFSLRGQTNPLSTGLNTNWGILSGVGGNSLTLPRHTGDGSVFFQLFQR